jgi:carbamoyl-phosphate synthase large subunit
MKKQITVLITCVGGDLVPAVVQGFNNSDKYDVTVIGADGRDNAIGQHFCDAFYKVPMGEADDYIDIIQDIVQRHNVQLIVPGSDGEALALSAHSALLKNNGCQVASPSSDILAILNDKAKTYQRLNEANIPCAQWYGVDDLETLNNATKTLYDTYSEFVIKPALSRGGRDVFVVRSDLDREEHYYGGREIHLPFDIFQQKYLKSIAEFFPVVVMERLYEPTYDLDVLSQNGRAIQIVPRLRHNPAGIPFTGNTIKSDQALLSIGEEVAKAFKLSWLLDVDVMSKKDGTPVVLEVNSRLSGSSAASIQAGIPLYDQIMDLAFGEEVCTVGIKNDQVVVPYNALRKL